MNTPDKNLVNSFSSRHNSFKILLQFLLIMVLIVFTKERVVGQSYQPIDPARTYYFETSEANMSLYGTLSNLCPNSNGCALGVRVDSVIQHQNSTTYEFNKLLRSNNFQYPCNNDSWLGPKSSLLPNGDVYFFNGNGDTILVKSQAGIGSDWVFFNDGTIRFKATVDDIAYNPNALIPDSIKEITLTRIDSAGNPLPHELNNKQIKIGKTSGFVEVLDFYHFPADTTLKTIMGLSNPTVGYQNLSADKIFDYPIGAEFHYKEYESSGFDFSHIDESVRKIILNKIISTNSITYTIDRTFHRVDYSGASTNPSTYTYSSGRDTSQSTILFSTFAGFDKLPFEDASLGARGFTMIAFDTTDQQWMKIADMNYSTYPGDSCLIVLIASDYPRGNYKECLGLTAYYTYGQGNNTINDRLVYYKKGNVTWGDSINFKLLLNNKELNQLSKQPVLFYPNPTSDFLYLKDYPGNKPLWVQVYDMHGRLLDSQMISPTMPLNVQYLNPGIYSAKIVTEGKFYTSSFVKLE